MGHTQALEFAAVAEHRPRRRAVNGFHCGSIEQRRGSRRPSICKTCSDSTMPDVIEADPLILSRWRVSTTSMTYSKPCGQSFHELRQWIDWAQTMPSRTDQLEVLTAGHAAFEAATDFGYVLPARNKPRARRWSGGARRRVGPGASRSATGSAAIGTIAAMRPPP